MRINKYIAHAGVASRRKAEELIKEGRVTLNGKTVTELATIVKNGDIVPCTNLLENPSTLLEDPRMEELLDKLAEDYRYVIVDAPPLVNVADGVQMAHMCDGAILVVNSGETSKTLVKQSLNQLERADCRLLGVILNKAQTATRAYYKYYGKYGSYYYGKDHNSEN